MLTRLPTRTIFAAVALSAVLAGCNDAPAADPEQVRIVEARQENFQAMKDANDAMKLEAEKAAPDMAVFRQNAAILIEHAARIPEGFPEGSGPETGIEMEALPIIWEDRQQFEERAENMQEVLQQFSATAAGDDVEAVRAGLTTVGNTCRECHEVFRQQD